MTLHHDDSETLAKPPDTAPAGPQVYVIGVAHVGCEVCTSLSSVTNGVELRTFKKTNLTREQFGRLRTTFKLWSWT